MSENGTLQKIWHHLYFKLIALVGWLGLVWLLMESRMPTVELPGNSAMYLDKIVHVAIFGVLAIVIWRLLKMLLHRRSLRLLLTLALSLAYAGLTEYFQQFVPSRSFSLADLSASLAGILLALILIYRLRESKPRLLVHLCCGPCAAGVMRELKRVYFPALLFSNSNIDTPEEFAKRYRAAKKLADYYGIRLVRSGYGHKDWLRLIAGQESAPERGSRCLLCYRYRLSETAMTARKLGYDYFATSLTTSPHKNRPAILAIGRELSTETGVKFLDVDFGAGSGYRDSIRAAKHLGLYRQNYCGCEFSRLKDNARGTSALPQKMV